MDFGNIYLVVVSSGEYCLYISSWPLRKHLRLRYFPRDCLHECLRDYLCPLEFRTEQVVLKTAEKKKMVQFITNKVLFQINSFLSKERTPLDSQLTEPAVFATRCYATQRVLVASCPRDTCQRALFRFLAADFSSIGQRFLVSLTCQSYNIRFEVLYEILSNGTKEILKTFTTPTR